MAKPSLMNLHILILTLLNGHKISRPFSETDTEKSEFCSIKVLDETADSKATVFKTLNILHKKFQIGKNLQYLVVVGDGKSYDHLIKLKSEYGGSLSWVLPYPGDWQILFFFPNLKLFVKNIQSFENCGF
jgi:hypothetical protein